MQLQFEKYEGIGNDFIVVKADDVNAVSVEKAIALCSRHYGVGADGVLIVTSGEAGARARMTVINSDGSRPEMCGNGLRCVALSLVLAGDAQAEFVVDTDAGPRHCVVERSLRDPATAQITTAMGTATLLDPLTHHFAAEDFEFARVSIGNPHAICFRRPISNAELDRLGPEVSARLPGGANVEIATLSGPRQIDVSVWERGVGRTLACGTGAAATAFAAVKAGHCPVDQAITVVLPGGPLDITVAASGDVSLKGPARRVFSGQIG